MKSELCCIMCSIMLLCTDAFGMSRERGHNYSRSWTDFQKYNRKENYRYDYKSDYRSYKRKPKSTYCKDNYNAPDPYKRETKKRKILDEERKDINPLLENYNCQEALNFFKEVSESESYYPTLIWDDNHVDNNKLPKVDFGKFDQRKKFIDMFENYDERGVSNFIQVNFSYGGLQHNMFIKQYKSGYNYSTDDFWFQNLINFNEKQASNDDRIRLKPYLSKENKIGILAKFIKHPEGIQKLATNVLRIIKLSPKGISPADTAIMGRDRVLTFEAFEIAGMILSTERLRSKKSLLLSYIEFYKLKHTKDSQDGLSMLKRMFDKDRFISTLKFPASGGQKAIKETPDNYIYEKFLDMIKYSPEYQTIQQCKNRDLQLELINKFFHGKLEKIRAVLENRHPKFKSKFKSAIQNYLQSAKGNTANPNDESK